MSMSSTSNASGRSIFSYKNGNVILAAIVLLLIVTLLVLLLHIYAKWVMAQARRRRRSRHSISGPNRLHAFTFETANNTDKGLDASVIASIPLFVYAKQDGQDQECVICLSGYEVGDVGRRLSGSCGHAFHVECIDMWLRSHSACPLCRAPVVAASRSDGSSMELDIIVDDIQDADFAPSEGVGVGVGVSEGEGDVATTTSMGASLKRMMSCGNKSGRKVHPSASSSSDSNV